MLRHLLASGFLACVQIPLAAFSSREATTVNQLARLPLFFEANLGQTDSRVRFVSRGPGYALFLTGSEAVLKTINAPAGPVRIKFAGSNSPALEGIDPRESYSSYIIGKDPAKWRTRVPQFGRVRYKTVYPGIDLVFYGTQRELEFDFVVEPRADPSRIRLSYSGVRGLKVDELGDLVLQTGAGDIRQARPVVYQDVEGVRRRIDARYRVHGHEARIELAAYDRSRTLVIDPVVSYSTLLGGSSSDDFGAMSVDSTGSVYLAGPTTSLDFPVTGAAFQRSLTGANPDIYVAKLLPDGSGLAYATYLGTIWNDVVVGLAVDSNGCAYITGWSPAPDFPTTPGAFETTGTGIFVAKLNAAGSGLVFSTFIDNSDSISGQPSGIAVDASQNVYIVGQTYNANFPVTPGALQPVKHGSSDVFVCKLDSSGSTLVYSTFLGGADADNARDMALDSNGNVYVTGNTYSSDFPTTAGVLQPNLEFLPNAFVAKLNSSGTALFYSTLLGGAGYGEPRTVSVDSAGRAVVIGRTSSSAWPTTPGALRTSFDGAEGSYNGFITKISPDAASIVWSTYFGSAFGHFGRFTRLDTDGNIYLCGSGSVPVTAGAIETAGPGGFFAKIAANGEALLYSTYITGGTPQAVLLDAAQNVYLAGTASSGAFETTPGAFQRTFAGYTDAFVMKLKMAPPGSGDLDWSATPDLVWQNEATRQTTVNYYSAAAFAGWNWLYTGPVPGWHIAAVADMNLDGRPDMVWQNDATGQVTVNYFGGSQGNILIGWDWLYSYPVPGWHIAGIADFNGDGAPDVVWQKDDTRQVTVNYFRGVTLIGWNWLYPSPVEGWKIVAVDDFNSDGKPDIVWQKDDTRQATVNYFGGPEGTTFVGWNWLYGDPTPGWRIAGTNDFNGDGKPDIVWRNETTGQVTVNYFGGTDGAAFQGWDWLNAAGAPGWRVIVPR